MSQLPDGLNVPPYHTEIVSHLRAEQAELWRWFSSNPIGAEQADAVRLELLKSAYRVDPESDRRLYDLVRSAAQRLGLETPITLYHSQRVAEGMNAHLAFLPDEIHLVLHGPLADVLDDLELQALLGHELSHYILWTAWDNKFLTADQVLSGMADDGAADAPQRESLRLFRLYAEIFCDRGGRIACGELLPAIGALVKTETGVRDVNAASYLQQVEEIAGQDESKTTGSTHPECHIRARALNLWHEQATEAEDEIRRIIEGEPALSQLDLLAQKRIEQCTRRLMDSLLSVKCLRTQRLLGHARLFFAGYEPPESSHSDEQLASDLRTGDSQLRDYYCYVLLDFVTADRDLDEAPLAAALLLAQRLDLNDRFEEIARKELRMRKKQLEAIRLDAENIVTRAGQEVESA